jgi:hypothetical protein
MNALKPRRGDGRKADHPPALCFDFPSIDDLCRHLAGLLRIEPENAPAELEVTIRKVIG